MALAPPSCPGTRSFCKARESWHGRIIVRAATVPDLLRDAAREASAAEAFRYRDERLTYADWDTLADRVAAGLAVRGVGRGDVVALLLPSTPFYLVAYLGAARLGAITTGINVRYRRSEIGHILRRSGARCLLAVEEWHEADFRSTVEGLRAELPGLAEVVWLSADRLRVGTANTVADLAGGARPASAVPPAADDPVAIVFTSGTTGIPKGAWYSHRNLLALAEIDGRRHAGGAPSSPKHLAAGLSFAHIGTMARIAIQIAHRGTSIVHDAFDPAAVLEVIERERLEDLGGIPTQVIMLLDHPDRARRDLSSLRSVLVGGAPAAPALIHADGWVHTGDVGVLDAAGYLRLRGRRSEMFIRGGYNVYPAEIEELLAHHPKVARAAIVGLPDPVFGEVGWAFVVSRDPAAPPDLAELRAFVGAELASFKRPDGLTLLPELPLTPMYKVDKRALRTFRPATRLRAERGP